MHACICVAVNVYSADTYTHADAYTDHNISTYYIFACVCASMFAADFAAANIPTYM